MPHTSPELWYTRPVLFVRDVQAAQQFYCDSLGFAVAWSHAADGRVLVTQVNRGDACEVILCEDAARAGKGRLFIELVPEAVPALAAALERKQVPVQTGWWGMPVLQVTDPCGNELLFPTGATD